VSSSTDQSPVNQLTPPNSGDALPDFSPDGTQIAFQGPNNTIDTLPTGGERRLRS
jgi:Tol biopolymer transport system component